MTMFPEVNYRYFIQPSQPLPGSLQMLNFESSHQSIFHGVVPVGLGLSMVMESQEKTFMDETVDNASNDSSSESNEGLAANSLRAINN